MSNKILADTCIWIDYFKGKKPVSDELRKIILAERLVIAGPVVYELLQGARNRPDADTIKEAIQVLPSLEITKKIWLMAGNLSFELRSNGITLPPSDALLSAVALANDCSLFTIDSHFDHFPGLKRYPSKG